MTDDELTWLETHNAERLALCNRLVAHGDSMHGVPALLTDELCERRIVAELVAEIERLRAALEEIVDVEQAADAYAVALHALGRD